MFLSGKVVLSDGTPPPEAVMIERVCNSNVHTEGFTDSKGRFSINLGSNANAAFEDASSSSEDPLNPRNNPQGGTITQRALMNCELRASLAGFRSDTVSLMNRRRMDNPDVGTIILHRLANVEGLTISATTGMAPKDAKKAFDKGKEALQKGKPDDAAKHLEKAVEIYPKFAVAWNELGRLRLSLGQRLEARTAFEGAIQADSHFVSPYEGVAQIAALDKKWKEVAEVTDRALRMNPDLPLAQYLNAVANLDLHNFDAAQRSADALVKMNAGQSNPRAYHVIGLIKAQHGDYEAAVTNLQKFIETSQPGPPVELAKKQLAEIQKLAAAVAPAPKPEP
jgi:tetratricopeptide (TPR) repeat protein